MIRRRQLIKGVVAAIAAMMPRSPDAAMFLALAPQQYFATDGDLSLFANNDYTPAIIYVSATNTYWISYVAYNAVANWSVIHVLTFNASTGTWAGPYSAGTVTLTPPNSHNVPAIMQDNAGYIHIAYGAQGAFVASFSSTVNPNDPTSWRIYPAGVPVSAAIGMTFPRMINTGSALLLFYSGAGVSNSAATEGAWYVSPLTSTSGVLSSGTKTALIDFSTVNTDNLVFLPGRHWNDGTYIHFPASFFDATTNIEQNIYLFKYRLSDGAVLNYAGTTVVTSFPISKAAADANFLIINQAGATHYAGGLADYWIDSSNVSHLLYGDSASPTNGTSACSLLYTNSALSWGSPTTLITYPNTISVKFVNGCMVPNAAGGIDFYYPDGTFTAAVPQSPGNIVKTTRSSGGSFGSQTTVQSTNSFGFDLPTRIDNPAAIARVAWGEVTDNYLTGTDSGALKGYLYGDSGFVTRVLTTYLPATTDLLARFTVQPSAAYARAINNLIGQLQINGIWDGLDVLFVFAANDAQSSLLNWVQNQYNMSVTGGAPAFTRNVGYVTNGSSDILGSSYNPSLYGRARLNDASIFAYVPSAVSANFLGLDDASANGLFMEVTTTTVVSRITDTTSNTTTIGNGTGFYGFTRASNGGYRGQNNTTAISVITQSSVALPNSALRIGQLGTSTFVVNNVGLIGIGRSMVAPNAQITACQAAVANYMAAVAGL
jgi:hypothetical protein